MASVRNNKKLCQVARVKKIQHFFFSISDSRTIRTEATTKKKEVARGGSVGEEEGRSHRRQLLFMVLLELGDGGDIG